MSEGRSPVKAARCACCGKPLKASEAAARAWLGKAEHRWCFPCWDDDPVALLQYQRVIPVEAVIADA